MTTTTTRRRQPVHWTNTVGAAISEGLSEYRSLA